MDEMKPLWAAYPELHPYHIFWRMGEGEGYDVEYWDWWHATYRSRSVEDKIAYVKRYPFRPAWSDQVLHMIWYVDYFDNDEATADALRAEADADADADADLEPDSWE